MRIPLVGGSYQARSLPFDAQRTVNLYAAASETGNSKDNGIFYGTPGLSLFSSAGSGEIRAEFSSSNGRAFVVSFNELYEITEDGVSTFRGALFSNSGAVTIDENSTQMAICDGENLHIFTYSTNTLDPVTDPDFPGITTVDFIDGYFVGAKPNSGEFYISDINNGTAWNSLDFATAEGSPDKLVRTFSALGNLILFGERTTEFWYNSGDVDFPFARIEGAKMETGCAARHSVVKMDNTVFWLGKDKDGQGIVYKMQGYTPVRISTHAIEYYINRSTDLSEIRAYTYQQDGHTFYAMTGGNLETTLVYDVSTGLWHERAYLESDGTLSTHIATTCMFAFGKHLVGDKQSGNIYHMSLDYYDDDGNEIKRFRTFPHVFSERIRRINRLEVDFEAGVGLTTGQGSDPKAWLQVSFDGARTWSPEYYTSIGKIGEYDRLAEWRRLGATHRTGIVTFRVGISDPVKVAISGAYLT